MNERIQELAEQAGFYFYDLHDVDGQDLGETIEADSWNAAEKFAELIVKECIQLNYDFLESYREACEVNDKIRKHFGVE